MSKDISTLVQDINHVLTTKEGYTDAIHQWVVDDINKTIWRQMQERKTKGKPTLRMSSLGKPCERQLWYEHNLDKLGNFVEEPLQPNNYMKFIFGDFIESFTIGLVMAAGHKVEGLQERVEVDGIVGHRDCIIDGMQVDVKSASSYAFSKFKNNQLKGYWKKSRKKDDPDVWVSPREVDSFGYISQNTSYLFASLHDPRITHKSTIGFLAIDKQLGNCVLDTYDVTEELKTKQQEIAHKKDLVTWDSPPERVDWGTEYSSVKGGEPDPNGNIKLTAICSYCQYKQACYPGLRKFLGSTGPEFYSRVVKEPKMKEITVGVL